MPRTIKSLLKDLYMYLLIWWLFIYLYIKIVLQCSKIETLQKYIKIIDFWIPKLYCPKTRVRWIFWTLCLWRHLFYMKRAIDSICLFSIWPRSISHKKVAGSFVTKILLYKKILLTSKKIISKHRDIFSISNIHD